MDNENVVAAALESALPPSEQHVDEDTYEYIASALSEDPFDEDMREAVREMILSATEDNDQVDGVAVCQSLFELLDLGRNTTKNEDGGSLDSSYARGSQNELRKLGQAVTMKEQDVQTFASGLRAETDDGIELEGVSKIAAFYANMIDPSASKEASSERDRRKARQKEMRIQLEEEERQRAIKEAMDMIQDDAAGDSESLLEKAQADNMIDVHLKNFELPNLRGGGPNLLQNACLTLARGRRYGLMGRNGCGKTTFLTFLAKRQIPNAVPKNMNMLLVRQEIIGNDWTAVETVVKSDVKRESVKRYIEWIDKELDRVENPEKYEDTEDAGDADEARTASAKKKESKGRQRLRDRKKQNIQKVAKKAAASTTAVKETKEERRKQLHEKLVQAHNRLGEIEAEEGGDPEPRARKVLAGLGFTKEMQDKRTQELSGGWRMRVSLSCALFANPSLLLLDEPTNHLDLEAVLWLERYLTKDFKGTLVVVSHDRHFLNEVVTDVVHFHKNDLTTYRGDISNFEAVVSDDKLRQQRLREQQESKRAHLQKYIDLHAQSGENGVKASKQRKSRMKKLDKLGVMASGGKKYKASLDGVAVEVRLRDPKFLQRSFHLLNIMHSIHIFYCLIRWKKSKKKTRSSSNFQILALLRRISFDWNKSSLGILAIKCFWKTWT